MNKKTALILFPFFDMFAFLVFWLGYSEIQQVFADVSDLSDSVSFVSRGGYAFTLLIIPVIHIYALFDYFKPSLIAKWRNFLNRAILIFTIALFPIAMFISAGTKHYVENSGYLHCDDASGIGIFFKTLVYTKDWETCDKLETARREKLRLPPKK